MNTRVRPAIYSAVLCVAILSSGGARAEGFIDVYLGGSYTDDTTTRYSSMASATTKFDDSTIGGVRGGVWIGPWPWLGFAGDISYFRADHDARRADIHVIPLSLLVMLRVPIFRSEELPGGRFQPYVGAGPAVFVSVLKDRDIFAPGEFVSADGSIGSDVRAAVKVQLLRWLAVFAEYRHTEFDAKWDDANVTIKGDIETDHFQMGVGFHF